MSQVRPDVAAMEGYVPGLQPDPRKKYLKLNSNENPFPPSPKVKAALQKLSYEDLRLYPDPLSLELRERLGALYGLRAEEVICGNGSDDILNIIVRTFVQPGESFGFHTPTFPLYRVLGTLHGSRVVSLPVPHPYERPPFPPRDLKVFFLALPNSPVGFAYPADQVGQMARDFPGIFVVDEAYAEFAAENALNLLRDLKNVLIVRTVSKSYSLAGIRLGYALGAAEWIRGMLKVKDPFNVTRLAQLLVPPALEDQEYFRQNISRIVQAREFFSREARAQGYRIVPSQANFVFLEPPRKGRGVAFFQGLFQEKVLARYYDEEGLRDGVRLTIGNSWEMEETLAILKRIRPLFV